MRFFSFILYMYFLLNLFDLWKGEALAEHVSWSRVSRVTLISMEFSSVDHSWSRHLPGLQHFKSDRKNLNPASQSITCVSNLLELFLNFPQLAWSFTDWHLSSPQKVLIYIWEINPSFLLHTSQAAGEAMKQFFLWQECHFSVDLNWLIYIEYIIFLAPK